MCGQYYPNASKLRFCLADVGIGFEQNVSGFLGNAKSDAEAIEWALIRGNSTRHNRPGGMGLYFLNNFIQRNGGNMYIVSGGGVVRIGKENYSTFTSKRYKGSYITMEINTDVSTDFVIEERSNGASNELF